MVRNRMSGMIGGEVEQPVVLTADLLAYGMAEVLSEMLTSGQLSTTPAVGVTTALNSLRTAARAAAT
jgi:hypothetical protein